MRGAAEVAREVRRSHTGHEQPARPQPALPLRSPGLAPLTGVPYCACAVCPCRARMPTMVRCG